MKFILLTFSIFLHFTNFAQSPYLSILVKMDSTKAEWTNYKIKMKICEPKKMTERGDWFTHEISKIDFALLEVDEIKCEEYFDNGMPELISGKNGEPVYNQFQFGNQIFAWGKDLCFQIF